MATLEEQKKLLIPFVQRAQEVEKAEPKIAYYCRMYALEQGLEIDRKVRAPEISGLLEALMGKLEKDRAVVQLGKEDALYCENFALTVFNRADRVDRAGRSEKSTAMTFYAASYFFEILRHFGEPQPDTLQKQRYAAWRAADISKAVKEGRQPDPPPAARLDTDEDAQMMDELAKLELAGASSAGRAAAAPPPPAGGRLSGLPPPLDEWGPSPPAFGGGLPPPPPQAPGGRGSDRLGAPPPPAPPPPGVTAAPFTGGGGSSGGAFTDDDGGFRLPSPPKQRPIEGQRSGGVWAPPPPRRFQTFQKVMYNPEGGTAAMRGTIAKVEEGNHPEHPTYLVALPDHIAPVCDPTALAPELATGETVMYHGPSGHSMEATVAEMDLSHWPPSYLVRLADGNYVDTTADRLHQLHVPRPRSEGANLDSLAAVPGGSGGGGGGAWAGSAAAAGGGMYPPPAVGMPHPPPPPASSAPPPPPQQPPAAAASPPRQRPAAAAAAPPPAAAVLPRAVPGYQPGLREITDASKLTKSAASALQFEDVATAVRLLTEAVTLLTQPKQLH